MQTLMDAWASFSAAGFRNFAVSCTVLHALERFVACCVQSLSHSHAPLNCSVKGGGPGSAAARLFPETDDRPRAHREPLPRA